MKTSWQTKHIGDVCEIVNGGTPKTGVKSYWNGNILWITPKDMGKLKDVSVSDTERKITEFGLQDSSAKIIPPNSIILSTRAPIGHLAINEKEISTNQGCKGLVPKSNLDTKFLYYFLVDSKQLLNDLGSGTTFKELSGTRLKEVEISLPELLEQKRIANKLDEVFEKVETAKENAEKNLQNSKELFESYLQSVFESLSENSKVKTLKELTTVLGDGLHGTPKYTPSGEYYFINGNNLNEGQILFKDSTKRVSHDQYLKYRKDLNNRSILVSINGTLGNVAFYNEEKIILGKSACYFNLVEGVDKNYVKYFLYSPFFQKYAVKEATGATIKNVSLKTMRELKIPIPKINKQVQIVKKLDVLSVETKKLEKIYEQKMEDLGEFKKSILSKAFAGEL